MASTITVPLLSRTATFPPAAAQAIIDVATSAIVDINALDAGREVAVKLATAAALPAGTYSNAAGTFTVTATGTLTVDGVVTALDDTILVKNQVSTFQNGLYYVTTAGAGGVSAVLTRIVGATVANDFQAGMLIGTGPSGTANPSTVFQQTSATVATLGTDAITYGRLGSVTSAVPTPSAAAKMLYDNGTAYVATAAGTAAQIPIINAGATAPVFVSVSGDATITAAGVVTNAKVNGATVPAAGALTTGNAAYASGASALTYSALNLAGGAGWVSGVLPSANLATATAAAAGAVTLVQQMGLVRSARGVVLTNQANLAAFTVASDDGITYIETDRVLLAGQTTATEDGLYVVGAVGGGTAVLTRAADYAAASVQPAGLQIQINEGTVFGGTVWFASLAGANTVGTSAPEFFPRRYVRITTAMAGTPGIKALSAEWILDATTSSATPTVITPGTQGFLSIGALTPGDGDGSFTVTSTANETSTLQIVIEN